jgi:hypothetical protein
MQRLRVMLKASDDWLNVPVYRRGRLDLRRIDIIGTVAAFSFAVDY